MTFIRHRSGFSSSLLLFVGLSGLAMLIPVYKMDFFIFTISVLAFQSTSLAAPTALGRAQREACQLPTTPALSGCPAGTIFVSPTDPSASFKSLQSAILSLPLDTSAHTILVGAGTYTEQINVTRPGPLTLLGQTSTANSRTANTVTVQWASAVINGVVVGTNASFSDNAYSSSFFFFQLSKAFHHIANRVPKQVYSCAHW